VYKYDINVHAWSVNFFKGPEVLQLKSRESACVLKAVENINVIRKHWLLQDLKILSKGFFYSRFEYAVLLVS